MLYFWPNVWQKNGATTTSLCMRNGNRVRFSDHPLLLFLRLHHDVLGSRLIIRENFLPIDLLKLLGSALAAHLQFDRDVTQRKLTTLSWCRFDASFPPNTKKLISLLCFNATLNLWLSLKAWSLGESSSSLLNLTAPRIFPMLGERPRNNGKRRSDRVQPSVLYECASLYLQFNVRLDLFQRNVLTCFVWSGSTSFSAVTFEQPPRSSLLKASVPWCRTCSIFNLLCHLHLFICRICSQTLSYVIERFRVRLR